MTKQEEINQLRKFPNHYLWNKVRSEWTVDDLAVLEHPSPEYLSGKKKVNNGGQAVFKIDGTTRKEYKSIAEASRDTGISAQQIYSVVNGRSVYGGGFKWEKKSSNINN
jgi:hypothetical protein